MEHKLPAPPTTSTEETSRETDPLTLPIDGPILVTGATGYVGGRLVPRLLEAGYRVRCVARSARKLAARPWASDPCVEIVEADLADAKAIEAAMRGCQAAYYLVHSMVATGASYGEADRLLAEHFTRAAAGARVGRIIYLGGLGEKGEGLSAHLSSRREVEAELAAGPVPVTVLRAAMIIGSGSASFEILRYLVERLPVMVTPRWVKTKSQPIAISNVLTYLVACLSVPATVGRTLDIGGPDVVSYLQLMRIMAEERGLRRRLVIPVPVLTPHLSSLWIHLVTPLSHRIARPLAEGLRNPVVCRDDEAVRLMPQRLLGVREAIRVALDQVAHREVETGWFDAGPIAGDPDWAGGTVFVDRREVQVASKPGRRVRDAVAHRRRDGLVRPRLALAAPGCSRPSFRWTGAPPRAAPRRARRVRRRHRLLAGDGRPAGAPAGTPRGYAATRRGAAGVHDRAGARRPGRSRLVQTARFAPHGLLGIAYWYAVLPFHRLVFGRMLEGIRRDAEVAEVAVR